MASPLSLLIGLRFSRGRRRGGMVSLISVISTVGIALGVAVLIVGLSAMNGFERELNNRILAVVPHGEIEAVNQPWNNWQEALDKVQKSAGYCRRCALYQLYRTGRERGELTRGAGEGR
ncbi:Lipoprotein releasing system transmembrane protein LolE [Citrobacter freundii]|uniref:Lipoprotein releasing system transmembrane protein LolE n=1 Tax=Citrobacter freundii TaxID=546 RepID=A0A7G2ITA4_CITFR|nr:Lipoprotein releasing system transmembrane protein LolE [Citrobacter freundii]